VLTSATTDLDIVLSGNSFEFVHLLTELGKMDMDGGSKSGSEVGGARGDVTQVVVVGEAGFLLNGLSGSGESLEDGSDISTLLHGDDTELILLIDPDEESLGIVVEDTSALWPVSVETTSLEETISFLEEEMIINKLLLILGAHGVKGVESSSKVTIKFIASLNDLVHNLVTLLVGDTWSKREFSQVSADSDTS